MGWDAGTHMLVSRPFLPRLDAVSPLSSPLAHPSIHSVPPSLPCDITVCHLSSVPSPRPLPLPLPRSSSASTSRYSIHRADSLVWEQHLLLLILLNLSLVCAMTHIVVGICDDAARGGSEVSGRRGRPTASPPPSPLPLPRPLRSPPPPARPRELLAPPLPRSIGPTEVAKFTLSFTARGKEGIIQRAGKRERGAPGKADQQSISRAIDTGHRFHRPSSRDDEWQTCSRPA